VPLMEHTELLKLMPKCTKTCHFQLKNRTSPQTLSPWGLETGHPIPIPDPSSASTTTKSKLGQCWSSTSLRGHWPGQCMDAVIHSTKHATVLSVAFLGMLRGKQLTTGFHPVIIPGHAWSMVIIMLIVAEIHACSQSASGVTVVRRRTSNSIK